MTHDDSLYMDVADGLHRITESGVDSYEVALVVITALYLLWIGRLITHNRRHSTENIYSSAQIKDDSQRLYAGDNILVYILGISLLTLVMSQVLRSHDWQTLLIVALGWHLLFAAKSAILWLSSYLSYNETIFSDISQCKIEYFVKTIIWSLPISLAMALSKQIDAVAYVAIGQSVIVLIGYIYQSNALFRSKKISILNWILYLCTVEIAMTVLLWYILSRNLV